MQLMRTESYESLDFESSGKDVKIKYTFLKNILASRLVFQQMNNKLLLETSTKIPFYLLSIST